jgi:hypothetical protein
VHVDIDSGSTPKTRHGVPTNVPPSQHAIASDKPNREHRAIRNLIEEVYVAYYLMGQKKLKISCAFFIF